MSFRRDGKRVHNEHRTWDELMAANADLIPACGLPAGVLRSPRDCKYLLDYGYWCENHYGEHVGNIDFDLNELNSSQRVAFRVLLERVLSAEEKQPGCAAWHFVCPPPRA